MTIHTQRCPGAGSCPLWFVSLMLPNITWEETISSWGGFPSDWPMNIPVGNALDCWLTWEGPAYYGQCNLYTDVSGLYKKTSWANQREREQAVSNIHSSCGKTLPSRSQHLTGPSVFYTGVQVTVGLRKVPKQRLNEFLSALESRFRT